MPIESRFVRSLKSPWQWVAASLILLVLAFVALGPVLVPRHDHRNVTAQDAHIIGLAMYSYANDNKGKYPTGNSSTEVFQKLIDGGYVSDPSVFCPAPLGVPGKTQAASNKLKPENVCWDVTVPADVTNSPPSLPLVFSTGFRITYAPGGSAVPFPTQTPATRYIIAVFYVNKSAFFLLNDGKPDEVVPNVVPASFDAKGVKYVQLTPDGPLP